MSLHWGEKAVAKCIPPELLSHLDEICCDSYYDEKYSTVPMYNAASGEKLFDMQAAGHTRRVSRRKLRNYLSQGLQVQYGKRLASIALGVEGRVVATFEDNTKATGSLIVGCDGARSVVREALVGKQDAQVEDQDIYMFNVASTFPKDIALLQRKGHPIFKVGYHPDGFCWAQGIQDLKDPDKPETWVFQNAVSWIGAPRAGDFPDQDSKLAFWREKAKAFAEPFKSIADNLPHDIQFGVDHITAWKPYDWTQCELWPLVTLAGDAAHNMPPFRGQGLQHALEDAAKLVDELTLFGRGQQSLESAVRNYEDEMKPRASKEVFISVMAGQMSHRFDQLMQSPMVQNGLEQYKEELAAKGRPVEHATDPVTGI